MQVVIYQAGPDCKPVIRETYEVDNLTQARDMIRLFFETERVMFQTNLRKAWITASGTEAHIFGYCRDEYISIIIEEDGKFDYMEQEWYSKPVFEEEPALWRGQE